jgi:hypothetical protein
MHSNEVVSHDLNVCRICTYVTDWLKKLIIIIIIKKVCIRKQVSQVQQRSHCFFYTN